MISNDTACLIRPQDTDCPKSKEIRIPTTTERNRDDFLLYMYFRTLPSCVTHDVHDHPITGDLER